MSELECTIMDLLCEMEQCTADEHKEFKVSWEKELRERGQRVEVIQFCSDITDHVINEKLERECAKDIPYKEVGL